MIGQKTLIPTSMAQSGKTKHWVFMFPVFSYLALGLVVIYWDLGRSSWGVHLADAGRALVPSISKISMITPAPDSSALVLTITWLYIPVVCALLMTQSKKLARLYRIQMQGWPALAKSVLWVFSLLFILYLPFHVPDSADGRYSELYVYYLRTSPGFILIWGGATLFSTLSVFMFVALGLRNFLIKFIGGEGDD